MKKPLIYGLAGLAVIILIVVIVSLSPNEPIDPQNPNTSSTEDVSTNQTPTANPPAANLPGSTNQTPKPAPQPTSPAPASQSIAITSPELDSRFDIGKINLIKWSREPGITAGLYLADTTTGTTIGWVTPTITSHQTSYSWDTKDVAVSRASGIKKSVRPGRYYFMMKFDGPITEARSNTFYVLYPEQDTSFTHNLVIQNFRFSPSSIAVRIGEKVSIQNKDQNTYVLIAKNTGETITLAPGETKTILTGSLSEGSYGYYSEQYSVTSLNIDIYK